MSDIEQQLKNIYENVKKYEQETKEYNDLTNIVRTVNKTCSFEDFCNICEQEKNEQEGEGYYDPDYDKYLWKSDQTHSEQNRIEYDNHQEIGSWLYNGLPSQREHDDKVDTFPCWQYMNNEEKKEYLDYELSIINKPHDEFEKLCEEFRFKYRFRYNLIGTK
jgi:hypothetical protein